MGAIGHEPQKGILRRKVGVEREQGRDTIERREGHVVETNGVYWGEKWDLLEETGAVWGMQGALTKQSMKMA